MSNVNAPIVVVYVYGPNNTPRLELRGNVARHFARDIERFDWSKFGTVCHNEIRTAEPRVIFTKAV